jgi:hypothetical protein
VRSSRVDKMAAPSSQNAQLLLLNELMEDDEDEDSEADTNIILYLRMSKQRACIPKVAGFADMVLERFSPTEFRRDFRISVGTYNELLDLISHLIQHLDRPNGKSPVGPDEQLLIYLWFIANQDSMREMSRLFGKAKSTIHRCVRRVSSAICSVVSKLIHWPSLEEQEEIAERIEGISQIPNVVGFIDGTHIRLSCIPDGDSDYINRKRFPSLQLQLVVSDSMLITDAYVGWPGCVHDARVYRNSPIHDALHDVGKLGPNKFIIGKKFTPDNMSHRTIFRTKQSV